MFKNTVLLLKKPTIFVPLAIFWAICLLLSIMCFLNRTDVFTVNDTIQRSEIMKMSWSSLIIASLLVIVFLAAVALIAGIGNVLKTHPRKISSSLRDVLYGITYYYEKALSVMLSLVVVFIVLALIFSFIQNIFSYILKLTFSIPDITEILSAIAFKSNISLLTMVKFLTSMLFIPLIAPLVAMWFPSVILDDMDFFEGLRNSCKLGIQNYIKMYFASIVLFLPQFLYNTLLALYCLIGKEQVFITNKFFRSFAALENLSGFMSLAGMSIYFVYLFVFYSNLKSKATKRAVQEFSL